MKKQLTILFALVAMTGWAQTAKKSAPESFKGTAVKDSASIYHTLPLPLPSKGEGLSAEGMFVPDVQMEADVSVWKAYFDSLRNQIRKNIINTHGLSITMRKVFLKTSSIQIVRW